MAWGRWGFLALVWLLALGAIGSATAQEAAPRAAEPSGLTTLRVAQVIPRLPAVHVYAFLQDEQGEAFRPSADALSLQVRPANFSLVEAPDDGVAVILLVDISRSLRPAQFALVQASLRAWIDSLRPNDKAAIITFGSSVRRVVDFTDDKAALKTAVDQLAAVDDRTLLYQGLLQAVDLAQQPGTNLTLRRGIVVLTDGLDDQEGGADVEAVRERLRIDPIPIYALGFSASGNARVDEGLKRLSGLVVASGGDYRRVSGQENLDRGYLELHARVNAVVHYVATCPACEPDGRPAYFQLSMANGARSATTTARLVNEDGAIEPPRVLSPWDKFVAWILDHVRLVLRLDIVALWLLTGALASGGAAAGYVVHRQRQKRKRREKGEETGSVVDVIVIRGSIKMGTHQDQRRLRLYALGDNDLGPWEFLFDQALTVGRDPANNVCISNDDMTSARHCTLGPADNRILVQDVGSRNGTRVNGVPVTGFMHAESDSILGVGRTEIRMRLLPPGVS